MLFSVTYRKSMNEKEHLDDVEIPIHMTKRINKKREGFNKCH